MKQTSTSSDIASSSLGFAVAVMGNVAVDSVWSTGATGCSSDAGLGALILLCFGPPLPPRPRPPSPLCLSP